MSLFEHGEFRWRETYFVLFDETRRPKSADVKALIKRLGQRFELTELRGDEAGWFESMTLQSPADNAAMDVIYDAGEEVIEQRDEMVKELARVITTRDEKEKLDRLKRYTARFEIFHFERIGFPDDDDDEEEGLDPGSLLILLDCLAEFCQGVAVDPQSGAFM